MSLLSTRPQPAFELPAGRCSLHRHRQAWYPAAAEGLEVCIQLLRATVNKNKIFTRTCREMILVCTSNCPRGRRVHPNMGALMLQVFGEHLGDVAMGFVPADSRSTPREGDMQWASER